MFKFTFDRFAGWMTIITFGAVLIGDLLLGGVPQQYRFGAGAVIAAAVAWIAISGHQQYVDAHRLSVQTELPPRVAVLGGKAYESLIKEIVNHKDQNHKTTVIYNPIILESDAGLQTHEKDLKAAAGVILMPDFSEAEFPKSYEIFCRWFPTRRTLPVVRLNPPDYRGYPLRDFPAVPNGINTAQGIVNQGPEYLFSRAVSQGWHLDSWMRLQRKALAVLLGLLLLMVVLATPNVQQYFLLRRILEQPANVTFELDVLDAKLREASRKGDTATMHQALQARGALMVEEIKRISLNTEGLSLHVFVPVDDRDNLQPVIEVGTPPYPVPTDGLVGCVIREQVAIYWRGMNSHPEEMQAWDLAGNRRAMFKPRPSHEPSNSSPTAEGVAADALWAGCENRPSPRDYPKKEFLCIPLGGRAGGGVSGPATGAMCLLRDSGESFLSQDWLRNLVLHESRWMNVIDLTVLARPESAAMPARLKEEVRER